MKSEKTLCSEEFNVGETQSDTLKYTDIVIVGTVEQNKVCLVYGIFEYFIIYIL